MRFDSRSGDFLAAGNVIIQVDGLTVRASRGTGNVEAKEVHFTEGIAASGDWRGDKVDLAAGSISLYFAQTPTYIAEGGVKGRIGSIFVDADKFYMKGSDISARGVRRLENRAMDVAFGAESLQGVLLDGQLTSLTARDKVWLRGRPNAGGETVDIRGDAAVYSIERGSVVLSGNVRATQKGRTLSSQSIVYFPANNRLEAIGGVVRDGKNTDAKPARITIDLKQEGRRAPK
jgi:lipopolysaccharide assembly outer membrane protein LptD (OstA)